MTVGSPRLMNIWVLEDDDGDRWWSCRRPDPGTPATLAYRDEAVAVVDNDGREYLVVVGGGWVVLYDVKEKRTVSNRLTTPAISGTVSLQVEPHVFCLPSSSGNFHCASPLVKQKASSPTHGPRFMDEWET